MKRNDYSIEQVADAIKTSKSLAEVMRKLGLRPSGGNYSTLHRIISKHQLDTSHFTGQGWNKGLAFIPQKVYSHNEIFIDNSSYRCNRRLKQRLFDYGYKEKKCEICGLSEWLGKAIPLEVHHINGCNYDNRLENLLIVCPNCHAQTEHYRGNAKRRYNDVGDLG